MEDQSVVYDNEQFALDDDITRRLIYRTINVRNDTISVMGVNFVASQFKKGATQWSHLEEPWATLYHKIMNLAAFAIGNKQINSVIHPATQKKKKLGEPVANPLSRDYQTVIAISHAVDTWYGRCRNNDNIIFHIETLFDAIITSKVAGFRIWLLSKVTKSAVRPVSTTTTPVLMPIIQTPNENRLPVDVLGVAMRHSLQEANAINVTYRIQRDKYITMKNRSKKTPSDRLAIDTALYPLYNYTNHETILKCFSNIFRRCLHTDINRVAGDSMIGFPLFKDSRATMNVQYNIEEENNAAYIVKNTFTKEAAMFYHVRTENIMPEQRDLNNYIHVTDRVSTYDPDLLTDVTQLVDFGIRDSSFCTYYNEQTTYQLKNEHISAEFYHNMPLPHRIGAQLPTRQKVGIVTDVLEDGTEDVDTSALAAKAPSSKRIDILEESDDDDSISSSTSSVPPQKEIPDYVDEEWLAEHDLDGTMAQRIFDMPASYGYKETILKPLGLHQVIYTVNARRILACKSNAINAGDIEKLSDDFKRKFIDTRKEYIACLIQGTILQSGGKECSKHKLLACDHADPSGTMNINGSITPSNHADPIDTALAKEVYRASTLNYIVKNGKEQETEDNEEETVHLDDDDDDDEEEDGMDDPNRLPGFRVEGGEFMNEEHENIDINDKQRMPRFFSNRQLDEQIPFIKKPNNKSYDREWESFIANATLDVFLPILEKRRPKGNSMADVHTSPDIIRDEEWMLKRDVYLRMCALNKKAFRALDREYFDQRTRKIPKEKYAAYKTEKNRHITAATVEVWNEFFTSPDVSYANEGIRGDWIKATASIVDGKKQINHSHHTRVTRLDVLPYHQYKVWCYELFAVVLDVHYNHKIMYNNYTAKYHHCRWQVDSTDPKLNIINHGDNMGGKSFILRNVKKTCPSMVGDMVTQITDKAFNVDRNLNDMLIIIEEMENKYLGIMPGGGKSGPSGGSGESDALSFFKNRLTSGISAVIHFFIDEEHNNRRDCRQANSSCQGSYLCATNAKLADADRHLLSRFTLQSVPKSFGDKNKNGPKAGSGDTKPQFGTENRQHDIIYEEHKDVHRLYYFVEQCIKSNVINNNAYGASIDGANLMISTILNKMHQDHGIPTDNGRKRNSILEFARCTCLAYACWNAYTSPALRHYQYDPLSGEYIGINPRMIIFGVFPFLLVTKDMVIDALTSLSGLWQHDHLKNVLQSIVVSTNLTKPIAGKYRLVTESELETSSNIDYTDPRNKGRHPLTPSTIGAARAASGAMDGNGDRIPMKQRNMVGIATQNGVPVYINAVPDYNYVSLVERTYDMIYKNISKQLGELQISSNDIEKILKELSEETSDIAIRSYTLENGIDKDDEAASGALVLDINNNTLAKPKIVIIDYCPKTKKPRVSILVSYLKEQLPLVLENAVVQDLRLYQVRHDKAESDDDDEESATGMDDDDDDQDGDNGSSRKNYRGEMDDDSDDADNNVEEDTLELLIAKLDKASRYEARGEAKLILSILSSYETSINDKTCIPDHIDEEIRKEYTTIFSKYVPWDRHGTADHPSSIMTGDVYKASAHAIRHNNKISKEITFYDTMKSLTLRRKGTDKVIIPNHSYVSPSAMATLSIFDPLITENDVIKSTQDIYNHSSSWELLEDIDFTCGKAHLANIGYEPLDTEDIRFRCVNYQPFLYQIHADYSRTRLDKHKKGCDQERKTRKAQYTEAGDTLGIAKLKKEKNDAHIASVMCEYPLCSMLSKVNHQGDIINNTLYGCDANSVIFHEMLLANSESMKQDFALCNSNIIRAKKRAEYRDEESKKKAVNKVHLIYTNRLRIKSTMSAKNLQKQSRKRHHSGVSKSKSNSVHNNAELRKKAVATAGKKMAYNTL